MTSLPPRGLLIVVVLVVTCQGFGEAASVPHIHGPEERTEPSGSNFTLVCSGTEPFHWIYPNFTSTTFEMDSERSKSKLNVYDSNYMDTGYYECISSEGRTQTYVFVSDENNLLAVANETFLPANEEELITIPCKPTAPDVLVDLYHNGVTEREISISYHPHEGFTVSQDPGTGPYDCIGVRNEKEQRITFERRKACTYPPYPEIVLSSIQHVIIDQMAIFNCTVQAQDDDIFQMEWIIPKHVKERDRIVQGERTDEFVVGTSNPTRIYSKTLTISRVLKEDAGEYTCRVTDHCNQEDEVTHYVPVYEKGYSFVNLTVHEKVISVTVTEEARWMVDLQAHPYAEIEWFDPQGRELIRLDLETKYSLSYQGSERVLTIHNVTFSDAGNYSVVAKNRGNREELRLKLIVFGEPIVQIYNVEPFYKHGLPANVTCRALGYPTPEIEWSFRKSDDGERVVITDKIRERKITDAHIESTLEWFMEDPVVLTCTASNQLGSHGDTQQIRVTDVPDDYRVVNSQKEVFTGDNVTLTCSVSTFKYHDQLRWYRTNKSLTRPTTTTQYGKKSFTRTLYLTNVAKTHSGEYVCEATTLANETQTKKIKMQVLDIKPAFLGSGTNMTNSEIIISRWQPVAWRCEGKGSPTPTITWYKDNVILTKHMTNYELLDNNQTLVVKSLTAQEEGQYFCLVENKAGQVNASSSLKLEGHGKVPTNYIIGIAIVAIFFIALIIGLILYTIRIRREKKELSLVGLQYFKNGMTGYINHELPLEEQTNLLPYDPKWEFPQKKLKLGKQLGAGAFGMVVKAEAMGIIKSKESTTVAVKMAKYIDDPSSIKALASELKILIHLGKHLNVVNLLGACTKNLAKRELYVIVEFCKYGNIQNYLLKNRSVFINEIDPETGEIDPEKGMMLGPGNRSRIDYATLTFPRSVDSYCEEVECQPVDTATTLVYSAGESTGSSLKQDWCPKLEGDTTDGMERLSTSTLLCWGFQIARGMEYLASRRVLHGDLAARNILLAENNIVKICDFGLAKNIYSNPEYQKTGVSLLPVKWMAIESLNDQVFSTQSDVWSFGIVLWELFSLSTTPYPGLKEANHLLSQLIGGYRLPKPQYATQKLYEVMLECWADNPACRPTFSDLVNKLGNLMESNVREHYIELNAPFKDEAVPQQDYLAMFSPPVSDDKPHYVNFSISKDKDNGYRQPDYLDMKRPTSSEDAMEMKPMLPRTGETITDDDDYLIPRAVPTNSAFNSSYLLASKVDPRYHQVSKPGNDDIPR